MRHLLGVVDCYVIIIGHIEPMLFALIQKTVWVENQGLENLCLENICLEELDRFMLNELIDRITMYETPGMGRYRKGKEKVITIHYKFVGVLK